jgi:AcrR family transcriptional regulator
VPAPIRRPYLSSADRRHHLLGAAGRLFDRGGFGAVTMAGVAAEGGVSRQLVYDHFGDVDGLYLAFVQDRLARYRASLPDLTGLDVDGAARASFGHLLSIPTTDRRILRLLLADTADPALDRVRARFLAEERSRWRALRRTPDGVARAVLTATTSALLALADAVAAGDISRRRAVNVASELVHALAPEG